MKYNSGGVTQWFPTPYLHDDYNIISSYNFGSKPEGNIAWNCKVLPKNSKATIKNRGGNKKNVVNS